MKNWTANEWLLSPGYPCPKRGVWGQRQAGGTPGQAWRTRRLKVINFIRSTQLSVQTILILRLWWWYDAIFGVILIQLCPINIFLCLIICSFSFYILFKKYKLSKSYHPARGQPCGRWTELFLFIWLHYALTRQVWSIIVLKAAQLCLPAW